MEREASTIKDVTDLHVYRKAYGISIEMHHLSFKLPKHEQYELAAQIRRASKSVCATLAEGFGKQSTSKAEFKRYIQMSLGSADEMRLWLQYCLDLNYCKRPDVLRWQEEYRNIAKMLTGLYHKWN